LDYIKQHFKSKHVPVIEPIKPSTLCKNCNILMRLSQEGYVCMMCGMSKHVSINDLGSFQHTKIYPESFTVISQDRSTRRQYMGSIRSSGRNNHKKINNIKDTLTIISSNNMFSGSLYLDDSNIAYISNKVNNIVNHINNNVLKGNIYFNTNIKKEKTIIRGNNIKGLIGVIIYELCIIQERYTTLKLISKYLNIDQCYIKNAIKTVVDPLIELGLIKLSLSKKDKANALFKTYIKKYKIPDKYNDTPWSLLKLVNNKYLNRGYYYSMFEVKCISVIIFLYKVINPGSREPDYFIGRQTYDRFEINSIIPLLYPINKVLKSYNLKPIARPPLGRKLKI